MNSLNPFSANPTKWSNTLKQLAGSLPMNCLSAFDHFMKLVLKRLTYHLWVNLRVTFNVKTSWRAYYAFLSSIVFEVIRTISSLFIFLRKDFKRTKP